MFNCEKCGACCRAINCKYLTKDNLCSTYEHRPIICNIDKMHSLTGGSIISKDGYYKMNKLFCEFLRQREAENEKVMELHKKNTD